MCVKRVGKVVCVKAISTSLCDRSVSRGKEDLNSSNSRVNRFRKIHGILK